MVTWPASLGSGVVVLTIASTTWLHGPGRMSGLNQGDRSCDEGRGHRRAAVTSRAAPRRCSMMLFAGRGQLHRARRRSPRSREILPSLSMRRDRDHVGVLGRV